MIEVEGIQKHFHTSGRAGLTRVLDDVTFAVERGEVLSLVGPSGCGKTTTLRCLCGLEAPEAGVIRIGGSVVADPANGVFVRPEQRPVAMVFQSYALWPHMSVIGNIMFPLRRGRERCSKAEALERAQEALRQVQLLSFADRSVTQLSGGQQQRVALARAVALRPKAVFMDEPLSNLDATLRVEMISELQDLLDRLDLTVVYVTHAIDEACSFSRRIAVMDGGQIIQLGTPAEVLDKPLSVVVLRVMGGWNPINLAACPPELRAGLERSPVALPAGDPAAWCVAFRHRDLGITRDAAPDTGDPVAVRLKGTVVTAGFVRDEQTVKVDLGGRTVTVITDTMPIYTKGETVRVSFPMGRKAHVVRSARQAPGHALQAGRERPAPELATAGNVPQEGSVHGG